MGPRKLWGLLPYLATLAVIAAAYTWTIRSNNLSWNFGAEQKDYYNLLVDGFLDGHLNLKVDVPAELLRCADPYDPAKRPEGVALHDASLYHGKYYIYYGVVPAAIVLLPFRVIAGCDLPVPAAVLGFTLAAYVVALALMADLRRRFFPRCGAVLTFLLCVGFGFASCAPILLRRSSMYELPIACGSFCALSAIGAMYLAMLRPDQRGRWLALASLAWGLAIGSRPTYLFAPLSLLFAYPILFRDASGTTVGRRRAIQFWIAAVVPIAAVGILLAIYNYQRFGSPIEFGLNYILSGVYESKVEHFRLRYVGWNIRGYFLAMAEWGRYFPFFHPSPIVAPRPPQHFGMDHPFGLLVNVPLVWLGAVAFRRRAANGPVEFEIYRAFVFAAAWWACTVTGLVLCFYAAMARYLGDFAPGLALLGAVGGMSVRDCVTNGSVRRRSAASLVAILVGLTVFIVFAASVQIYGGLRPFNPARFAALSRIANAPVHALEALVSQPKGAIELQLTFSAEVAADHSEELVRTGWGEEIDRVLVEYPDAQRIRFAYEHAGAPTIRSDSILVDRTQLHLVKIALGSLYPPTSWPGYTSWTSNQIARVARRLEITLDGVRVLERYQRFYGSSDGALVVGGRRGFMPFSGKILTMQRGLIERPVQHDEELAAVQFQPPRDGVWRFKVRFAARPAAAREPLIVSGETGRGDFVAVEYLGENRLRLMLDHWGSRAQFSEAIVYEPGRDYRLEIRHPAYGVISGGSANKPSELRATWDDQVVWRATAMLYPVAAEDIFVGFNPIGGSSCAERFSGSLTVANGP